MPREAPARPKSPADIAAQTRARRKRAIRTLRFLPFDWVEYPRLSRDGKSPIGCSRCKILYLESLTETLCGPCKKAIAPPVRRKREGFYEAPRELTPQEMREELEKRAAYAAANPKPQPAPEPMAVRRSRKKPKVYYCEDCGARKRSATGTRCRPCSKLAGRAKRGQPWRAGVDLPINFAADHFESDHDAIRAFLRERGRSLA